MRAVAAGLGTLAGATARAADNTLDFRFLHYGESDNRTQVENPELFFLHDFGQNGQFSLLLGFDSISGASPTGEAPTAVATTSASGAHFGQIPSAYYTDTRRAASLSYARRFGTHLPSVTLSYSRETDYLSRGFSLVDSWDLFGGRSTFHYGVGGTSDLVEPVHTQDRFSKKSLSLSAGWTQVLGPRDLMDVSLGVDSLSGYLTDPYKVVTVGSSVLPETRPDSRSRRTLMFKYAHYFLSRSALKTSYRYYWDDWSVKAHTIEASWDKKLGSRLILTPRVRYYTQGTASFFAYEFQAPEQYMSADYRLSAFWSWLAGLGMTYQVNEGLSFNLAATYQEQTGIDRLSTAPTTTPGGGKRSRGAFLFDDGEGGEGGGGGGSISAADMKVLTLTGGVSIKF